MNLIFIYGPPGVGKLTVGRELSIRTGYRLFHNHLTIEMVASVFDRDMEKINKLTELIRLMIFEEAAKSSVEGIIFTVVYGGETDDKFVQKTIDAVELNGGKVFFVQLLCNLEELRVRVLKEDRKHFNKINDLKLLGEVMKKYDLLSPIPNRNSLKIDNTHLSPGDVAQEIIGHYHLPVIKST